MINILKIELYKIAKSKRSYIGIFAVILIILIAQAAMLWEGQSMHEFLTKNLADAFYMQGNLVNGYLMTYIVLNFLWVHVPLLIVIVTGDLFSGEAHGGTFRLLLTRPVSRFKLVTAKFLTALVYTFILMAVFAIVSLGLGVLIFGKGDLMVIYTSVNILPEHDIFWRFMWAFGFGFIGMATVASLSLLLSSMSNNSLSPILSTMAIIILFTLITTFDFSIFKYIKPFLLTNYLDSWQLLFGLEVDKAHLIKDSLILILHIIIFYSVTLFYFNKKDILS
ncbi:MAG: ABC transporter permease [Bacteroidales bacterium]|nr:ABC transporter permease [Bacteroidales bacterium]MCF8405666.1 ABC transporter permease [Bacteroidales bacterium]